MSFEDDPFELRVGARAFRGWTAMKMNESIEDAVATLGVTLIGVYQDTAEDEIVAGDEVEAWVGNDRLFAGYAETFSDGLTDRGESLSISCRSRTCDLVDCSAPVGSWKNLRLDKLVRELAAGFRSGDSRIAVSVVFVDTVAGARAAGAQVIRRFRTEPGETAFAAIDRLAKEQGLLVTCNAAGDLVLTRVGTLLSTTRIVRGRNVLATSGTWDLSERFSEYHVKGATFTDTDVDAAATGAADDPGVDRYRPLVIVPDKGVDKEGALLRARWEAVTRAGKSVQASYTLDGWRQENGEVWATNTLVRVTDRRKRLLDATMLVKSLERTLDANSSRKTTLNLAPAAGFTPYVPGQPILSGAGRWLGVVEGTTHPDAAVIRRLEQR